MFTFDVIMSTNSSTHLNYVELKKRLYYETRTCTIDCISNLRIGNVDCNVSGLKTRAVRVLTAFHVFISISLGLLACESRQAFVYNAFLKIRKTI